jgi:uncharacterized spore protein YtfJ
MTTGTEDRLALADEVLRRIAETVGDKANVATIFGEPVERDGISVIPVARARLAFGGGGGGGARGQDEGSGGGGGGGLIVSPVGYIEVREDGAEFKRISSPVDLVALVAAGSLAMLAVRRLFGA